MKKIGFIDYYIDEWHANNYPNWIHESRFAKEFEIALAWEEMTPPDRIPLAEWCKREGVGKAESIEQVVAECDALVVLSPDNAERHEDLADLPLRSGKPVYIDKPIAPSLAAAQRLFAKATAHGTPMMSSSALRFGSQIEGALAGDLAGQKVTSVITEGPGVFHIYVIHQIEMLVMTLGIGAKAVMQYGNDAVKQMAVRYDDGRSATVTLHPSMDFRLFAAYGEDKSVNLTGMGDFFPRFIDRMLEFFNTRLAPIDPRQTLEIAALIEAGVAALETPNVWVPVPEIKAI
ncbi:MAG TPA: Gfo/Idh/MocA family oxidoreductase [Armatimonadota bacterium]